MRTGKCNTAFSIIEMLVVVSIIAVLVTIVIGVTTRLDTQGKISRTQNTFALLNAALSEFHDYGYCYSGDFSAFKFPLDCDGLTTISEFEKLLKQSCNISDVQITVAHDPNYFSCEAMYFFLNRLPQCDKIMQQIDKAFWSNKDKNGNPIEFRIDGGTDEFPLFRFVDPWGNTLRYDYYEYEDEDTVSQNMLDTRKTFPVLISAGPDGRFGTSDDIKSR